MFVQQAMAEQNSGLWIFRTHKVRCGKGIEFCILSIIRQGEVYLSDIVDKMKAANLHLFEGTLYPC